MRVLALLIVSLLAFNGAAEKEWWRHATFYQIYPRSFMDSNGDGIGDVPGIISRMEHLKEIGMDACWLSPIFASPQVDTGYDVSDFYTIEPDYGTMADFDNLMTKANDLGIKLMLDFIPNHTSDQHDWFVKSENNETGFEDYYIWRNPVFEGAVRKEPNNWISVFGGPAWTYSEKRGQFYLHQFSAQQPDLNYRNAKVVDEMKAVLEFYMKKGVAGFRLDAINHMFESKSFEDEPRNLAVDDPNNYEYLHHIHTKDLQETFDLVYSWRETIDNYVKTNAVSYDIILMTEAYASTYDTMRYYRHENKSDGRIGSHMPFNFQLIFNFYRDAKAKNIKSGIYEWLDNMPDGETADWVAGSHDHSRVASRIGVEKIHMVNTVVMTLPGASVTYFGEEIGMQDFRDYPVCCNDGRDPNRTPMQWNSSTGAGFTTRNAADTWLPINPNYVTINVNAQKDQPGSTYEYFKTVSSLRKNKVFREGFFHSQIINENVLAYSRELVIEENIEGYIVVINVDGAEQPISLSVFTSAKAELTVATAAPNSKFKAGDKVAKKNLTLAPYDAVIFYSGSGNVFLRFTLLIASLIVAYLS